MITRLILTLALVAAGITTKVEAQHSYLGGTAAYVLSAASPDTAGNGSNSRYAFGVQFIREFKKGAEFRAGLAYRVDEGSFARSFQGSPAAGLRGGTIQVVTPAPGAPVINSSLSLSAIELSGTLFFPLANLDTSGTRLMVGIGAFVDRILSATQLDDYTAIPDHNTADKIEYTYKGQFGGGAMLGASLVLPIGSDRATIDLLYTFREPSTIDGDGEGTAEQNISWFASKGFRLGISYSFEL